VKPFLALEWLRPGEGEDTAALRLLARIPDLYGSRFFGILLLDALYTQAPMLELARQVGWDFVISLKPNCPDLYQSAVRQFASRPADARVSDQHEGSKTYEVQLWDTEGLPFFVDHPHPDWGGALRRETHAPALSRTRMDDVGYHVRGPRVSRSSSPPPGSRPLETRKQRLDGPLPRALPHSVK